MGRTISVRGTGKLSVKPDLTVVTLNLKALDPDYEKMMASAGDKIEALRTALVEVGFDRDALKTENFNIYAENESVRDENGIYKSVFVGYACNHSLRLEFDFDSARLAAVLGAVASCVADPGLNICFTVKDREAVAAELLRSASANAREKAQILAEASGVKLGKLLSINYDVAQLNLVAPTNYAADMVCMAKSRSANVAITPNDIDVSDSASFIWELF